MNSKVRRRQFEFGCGEVYDDTDNLLVFFVESSDAAAKLGPKVSCPRPRLKRTGHPPDRKIGDFAEIISTFLATPLPLIRQNLRFRRNFVKHFSIPWNSDKFSSKSARKRLKLIQNSQKMMNFGGKNCKKKKRKNDKYLSVERCKGMQIL